MSSALVVDVRLFEYCSPSQREMLVSADNPAHYVPEQRRAASA